MPYSLKFNLAQNAACKVATFESEKEFTNYKEAENSDKACMEAYYTYQAAKTVKSRAAYAPVADAIRYSFYKRWKKTKKSETEPTAA